MLFYSKNYEKQDINNNKMVTQRQTLARYLLR